MATTDMRWERLEASRRAAAGAVATAGLRRNASGIDHRFSMRV
jgi:hypothetical protein